MTLLRSVLFNLLFFCLTILVAVLALPFLAGDGTVLRWAARRWAAMIIWLMRWICGIRLRIEGQEHLPQGACLIASNHQSAFDTIVWMWLLPRTVYVVKRELLLIPLYGWHARRTGMIGVDRAGGGKALKQMVRAAAAALAKDAQVVIFPEGTRVPFGRRAPFQPGVVAIAGAAKSVPVVPAATDSGWCWGRRSFVKRPGVITLRILPALPPGLPRAALMAQLEQVIVAETERLEAAPREG